MHLTGRRFAALLAATSLALLAGCGGDDDADDAEDKIEAMIERETGQDADIELDEDGERIRIQDGDTEINYGAGTELPEGWPEDLELPSGLELSNSSSMQSGGETQLTVIGEMDGDPEAVYEEVKESIVSAGYEVQSDGANTTPDGFFGTLSATKGDQEVGVTVMPSDERSMVTIYVGLGAG